MHSLPGEIRTFIESRAADTRKLCYLAMPCVAESNLSGSFVTRNDNTTTHISGCTGMNNCCKIVQPFDYSDRLGSVGR